MVRNAMTEVGKMMRSTDLVTLLTATVPREMGNGKKARELHG